MKKHVRQVIEDLKEEQQWKKDNGPIDITADQLWKYSGEVEESIEDLDECDIHFVKYYRRKIKNKNIYLLLNKTESKIIDYFYKVSDKKTIDEIAKDLNTNAHKIRQTISKHLKIMKNDKNNTG